MKVINDQARAVETVDAYFTSIKENELSKALGLWSEQLVREDHERPILRRLLQYGEMTTWKLIGWKVSKQAGTEGWGTYIVLECLNTMWNTQVAALGNKFKYIERP